MESATLQCADVGWTPEPDLPDGIEIKITGHLAHTLRRVRAVLRELPGDAPACTERLLPAHRRARAARSRSPGRARASTRAASSRSPPARSSASPTRSTQCNAVPRRARVRPGTEIAGDRPRTLRTRSLPMRTGPTTARPTTATPTTGPPTTGPPTTARTDNGTTDNGSPDNGSTDNGSPDNGSPDNGSHRQRQPRRRQWRLTGGGCRVSGGDVRQVVELRQHDHRSGDAAQHLDVLLRLRLLTGGVPLLRPRRGHPGAEHPGLREPEPADTARAAARDLARWRLVAAAPPGRAPPPASGAGDPWLPHRLAGLRAPRGRRSSSGTAPSAAGRRTRW